MPFTNKIQLGTYMKDGLRTGPVYPTKYASTNSGLVSANVTSADYGRFGKGILQSPIATYTFNPLSCQFRGATNGMDVCSFQAVLTNGYLTLNKNNAIQGISTNDTLAAPGTYAVDKEGNGYIQFDYPRVPFVWISGTVEFISPIPVTIFGTDGYGFPIQMTYIIDALTSAPTINSWPINNGAYLTPMKAFDTITAVYVNGALPSPDHTIGVSSSNIFGLPYKLTTQADVVSFRLTDNPTQNARYFSMLDLTGLAVLRDIDGASGTEIYCPALFTQPGIFQSFLQGLTLTYATQSTNPNPVTDPGSLSYSVPLPPSGPLYINVRSSNPLDRNIIAWTLVGGGYKLFKSGDTSTPSTFSGDPRGLVRLPSVADQPPMSGVWNSAVNGVVNGDGNVSINYYVGGADTFHNQLAASGALVGSPGWSETYQDLTPMPYLQPEDIYGVAPYYTGVFG